MFKNRKYRDKITELIKADRIETLANKDEIILESLDEEDCIERMNNFVDDFAYDFVNNDEFFKEVPQEEVDELKDELEPIFRREFKEAMVIL